MTLDDVDIGMSLFTKGEFERLRYLSWDIRELLVDCEYKTGAEKREVVRELKELVKCAEKRVVAGPKPKFHRTQEVVMFDWWVPRTMMEGYIDDIYQDPEDRTQFFYKVVFTHGLKTGIAVVPERCIETGKHGTSIVLWPGEPWEE